MTVTEGPNARALRGRSFFRAFSLPCALLAFAAALLYTGEASDVLALAFALGVAAATPALLRMPTMPSAAGIVALGFAAWLVVATLASSVAYVSAHALIVMALFFVGWLAVHALPDDGLRARLVLLLGALACAGAVLAVWQYAHGLTPSATFVNKNNLAALLVAGTFCVGGAAFALYHGSLPRTTVAAVLAVAALCFFVVGLIGSRGAWLGAAAAFALLLVLAQGPRRRLALYIALVSLAALLSANFAAPAGTGAAVASRLATFATPAEASGTRMVIWQALLPLATERPLTGVGPGTLSLHWAPLRHPLDSSAGWHAHNDYLQFAIETGWPGALLFIALLLVLLHTASRARNGHPLTAWLAAAITAIAVHSLFTFNFQLAPLLFVSGVAAGWISLRGVPVRAGWAGAALRVARIPLGVVLVALLAYAGTSTAGYYHQQQARAAVARGDFTAAYAAATRAIRWWPSADPPRVLRASILYKGILGTDGPVVDGLREAALAEALADLAAAQRLNPYRAAIPAAIALTLLKAEALGLRTDVAAEAEALYREALALQPRHAGARVALAELLEAQGRDREALAVLLAGVRHWSPPGAARTRMLANARALAERLGERDALALIPDQ